MYCWTDLQKQKHTLLHGGENAALIWWRSDCHVCLLRMRTSMKAWSLLMLKCDPQLMLGHYPGSCSWNTKIMLDVSRCRPRFNANAALDACLAQIELEIRAAYLGHWRAYKTILSFHQSSFDCLLPQDLHLHKSSWASSKPIKLWAF